jgi:hypothetical protein
MKLIILTITLISIILLSALKLSKSDCCGVHVICRKGVIEIHHCNDCTDPTPFCGENSCNIFGCNCNCRQKNNTLWCWKPDSGCYLGSLYYEQLNPKDFFNSIDTDFDEKISLTEAKIYFKQNRPKDTKIDEEFIKLDINNDNFLSFNEIDGY